MEIYIIFYESWWKNNNYLWIFVCRSFGESSRKDLKRDTEPRTEEAQFLFNMIDVK